MDGEGEAPWSAFREFLEGDFRDLSELADHLGRKLGTIKNYSSRWNWTDRAAAWDAAQVRAADDAVLDERAQMAREHLRLLADIRSVAALEVKRLLNRAEDSAGGEESLMPSKTVLAFAREAVQLERLVIGEATDRQEVKSGLDLSKLTIEELRLFKQLASKARE